MSAEDRVLFMIGERLGMSVAQVEALSNREVIGWLRWFAEGQRGASNDDGAVPLATLSKEELAGMFHHG